MEPWLSPLYDAEGIRAVDRWAIDEQGVPEGELMEAAGRALADAVAALPPQGLVSWYRAEGNANDFADGNNGTLQSLTAVTFVPGEAGQAFHFDGTPITARFIARAIGDHFDALKVAPRRKVVS